MTDSTMFRRLLLPAAAAVAMMGLGACGGDDTSSTESAASGSDAPAAGVSAEVTAAAKEHSATPTDVGIGGPVSKKPPTGLTVDFLSCNLSDCQQSAKYFEEAAKLVGWKVKTIVFPSSAEGIQNAFSQAVRDKPTGGVVTSGFVKQTYAKQLAELKAQGIPVVDYFSGNEAGDGIISAVGNESVGKMADYLAEWVTTDSGGKANVIDFNATSFGVEALLTKRMKANVEGRICKGCKYDFQEVPLTDIGPALPAKVVAAVQKNPDANYVTFGFGTLAAGVPAALKSAGLSDRVKIGTAGPLPSTFQGIINGEIDATAAQAYEQNQWCMLDALIRAKTGDEVNPVSCDMPSQILTKATVPEAWSVWPGVPNWKDAFKKNWLVGS